jgi:hypothetical protein
VSLDWVAAAGRRIRDGGDTTAVVIVAAVVTYPAGARVAGWCHVGDPWRWLYPAFADGLALVAYRSLDRIPAGRRWPRLYAWAVVVVCAGLSACGQALHLVGLQHEPPSALRAGVGAWPPLAGALAWHLRRLAGRAADKVAVAGQPAMRPAWLTMAARPPRRRGRVAGLGRAATRPAVAARLGAAERPEPARPEPARPADPKSPAKSERPAKSGGKQSCPHGCGQPTSARSIRRHKTEGCPNGSKTNSPSAVLVAN